MENIKINKEEQHIVWIRNAKVAGRSFNKAFSGEYANDKFDGGGSITLKPEYGKIIEVHAMDGGFGGNALGINSFKENYPDVWESAFKFILTRNPYDKFVSAYASMKQLKETFTFEEVININVEEFCKKFDNYDDWIRHVKYHLTIPQTEYVIKENGELDADLILKFENLNEDYAKLSNITGISGGVMGHVGPSVHKSYKEYYNEETAESVYNKFENDFKLLGYTKDSWK